MKLFTFLLILAATAWSAWVDLGVSDLDRANLEVVSCTPSGFVVEITIPGFNDIRTHERGIRFNVLGVPALTPYAEAEGAPMLPKASFLAAVPNHPGISITVEPLVEPVVFPNMRPSPMQPIPEDSSNEPVRFAYIADAYRQGSYPSEEAVYEEMGTIRGVNIARFNILPFHWDALTGDLTVTPRLRVTVDLGGSVSVDPRLRSRFFANTFRTLVNASMLGEYQTSAAWHTSTIARATNPREAMSINAADLLIIAGDDFVDTMMDNFMEMKMKQGYLTAIVAAGSWNQTQIKSYIQNAYDNWEIPPSFILFVGNYASLTSFSAPTGVTTDNRFVCMDGPGDYHADIFHSRFVTPTSHFPFVEEKILKWQFDPLMDPDFWGNALAAGQIQTNGGTQATRWFCFTLESVRDTYMNIYGKSVQREYYRDTSQSPPYYYRDDLPSAGQMVPGDIVWDGSAAGITAAINDGVFLVQHRNHGSVSGWAHPPFYISNLANLVNGEKTPMVMSINCSTGQFTSNCFAENFFRMEGGAVGVYAASAVSYSYWNDYLTYGLYKSFNDEFTTPPALYTDPTGNYLTGQAMMCSKIEMEASAPMCPYPNDRSEVTWDLFHWFGDPTMDMRTAVPHPLTVDAPFHLPSGSTEAFFSVSAPEGPVYNALVCMSHEDLWISGVTDSSGTVTLAFEPIGTLNDITWMVTSHNALPKEGVINGVGLEESQEGPMVTFVGAPRPNPARDMVTVPVSLAGPGSVEIAVFDLAGRVVSTLHAGELEAGLHTLTWDVAEVPQGVYFMRSVDPGGSVTTGKIVVAR